MLRGQLARKFTRFGLHERCGARATESVITRNLQRPIYPEGMQVIRWLIGTSTGGMFVFGYLVFADFLLFCELVKLSIGRAVQQPDELDKSEEALHAQLINSMPC